MKGRPLEERPEPLNIKDDGTKLVVYEGEILRANEYILLGSEDDLVEVEP